MHKNLQGFCVQILVQISLNMFQYKKIKSRVCNLDIQMCFDKILTKTSAQRFYNQRTCLLKIWNELFIAHFIIYYDILCAFIFV